MKIWEDLQYKVNTSYSHTILSKSDKNFKIYVSTLKDAQKICRKLNRDYYYAIIEGEMDSDSVKKATKILRSLSQKI